MDVRVYVWLDVWMDVWMDVWVDVWVDFCLDAWRKLVKILCFIMIFRCFHSHSVQHFSKNFDSPPNFNTEH